MAIKKANLYLSCLILFIFPAICWAIELEALKIDFLQGNYHRVVFEGQSQRQRINIGKTDELNYILGLSYLKQKSPTLAIDCFRRIMANLASKFFKQASMGLADSYLIQGRFQEAEDIYQKLIIEDSNSSLKAAVLYRLSQLEFKRNNSSQANLYFSRLKRDFPLSPESRPNKGLNFDVDIKLPDKVVEQDGSQYCVQVGFFSNAANANNLKNQLISKNYPAYIENSGTGYRVRVGGLKTQKEVLDLEKKLSQDGFPTKICP